VLTDSDGNSLLHRLPGTVEKVVGIDQLTLGETNTGDSGSGFLVAGEQQSSRQGNFRLRAFSVYYFLKPAELPRALTSCKPTARG